MSEWLQVILALVASLPGVLAILWVGRKEKAQAAKDENEAASAISDAAIKLLEPYKAEVQRLCERVGGLEKDLAILRVEKDKLEAEVGVLIQQVISLGGQPAVKRGKK